MNCDEDYYQSSESDSLSLSDQIQNLNWKLVQNTNQDDGNDTETSDLENFQEEIKVVRNNIDLDKYLDVDSSAISVKNSDKFGSQADFGQRDLGTFGAILAQNGQVWAKNGPNSEGETDSEDLEMDVFEFLKVYKANYDACDKHELKPYEAFVGR